MPCASSSTKRTGQPWDKPGHDGIYILNTPNLVSPTGALSAAE